MHPQLPGSREIVELLEVSTSIEIIIANFVVEVLGGPGFRIFCEPVALFLGVCERIGGVIAPEAFLKFVFDSAEQQVIRLGLSQSQSFGQTLLV